MPTMPVEIGFIDTTLDEVEPGQKGFGPQFEAIKQVEIATIGEGELILAVANEPFNGGVVVVEVRIGDQIVYPVHLHGDFPVYRNFTPKNRRSEQTIVFWRRRIGQCHNKLRSDDTLGDLRSQLRCPERELTL